MKFIFIVGITVGLSSDPQHYISSANVFDPMNKRDINYTNSLWLEYHLPPI